MKLVLQTLINNRRVYFFDLKKQINSLPEKFVIEVPSIGSQMHLFSVPRDRKLQTLVDGMSDIRVADLAVFPSFNSNLLKVKLVENKAEMPAETEVSKESNWKLEQEIEKESQISNEVKNVQIQEMPGAVIYYSVKPKAIEFYMTITEPEKLAEQLSEMELELEVPLGEESYKGTAIIYFAPQKQFYHSVLDFGSEASQIKHKYTHSSMGVDSIESKQENLFLVLKNYQKKTGEASKYIQYSDDNQFLKSIFYLQKKLGEYNPLGDNFFLQNSDQQLQMLTTFEEISSVNFENNYAYLPNLKLAHRHGSNLSNMMFGYEYMDREQMVDFQQIKEKVYATILDEMCKAYLYENAVKTEALFLRFSILIPNIYGLVDVIKTKNIIQKILDDARRDSQLPDILGWEVQTISESDASFLGYYNSAKNYTKPNNYYFIIDSGKGTTDFSILKTDSLNPKEIRPIYRNGFAGAGNLISYGYFESALKFLIEESENPQEAKKFFQDQLANISDYQAQQLFGIIEKWKFSYNPAFSQDEITRSWRNYSDGDINIRNLYQTEDFGRVLVFLSQLSTAADWGQYVQDALSYIATNIAMNIQTVVSKLGDVDFGGVLFSGRAFLYHPLYEAVVSKLSDIGISENIIEKLMAADKLKSVCMDGVLRDGNIIHPEMIGIPIQVPLYEDSEAAPSDKPSEVKLDFLGRMRMWATQFVDGRNFDSQLNEMNVDVKSLAQSKFIMSDSYFSLNNPYFGNPENFSDLDFIFTNEKYFFRAKNKQGEILQIAELGDAEEVGFIERAQITASLFPSIIDPEIIRPFQKDYAVKANVDMNFDDFLPS